VGPERAGGDRIVIEELRAECVVGVNEWERNAKQMVLISLELAVDLAPAGRSDQLADTVDYSDLAARVVGLAEGLEPLLIERLAEAIAESCLSEPLARWVRVRVDKPGAVPEARTVAVVIERGRIVAE
jgi:7,8-dihydroneopterin aldolase/epimerase/oxygenase